MTSRKLGHFLPPIPSPILTLWLKYFRQKILDPLNSIPVTSFMGDLKSVFLMLVFLIWISVYLFPQKDEIKLLNFQRSTSNEFKKKLYRRR